MSPPSAAEDGAAERNTVDQAILAIVVKCLLVLHSARLIFSAVDDIVEALAKLLPSLKELIALLKSLLK